MYLNLKKLLIFRHWILRALLGWIRVHESLTNNKRLMWFLWLVIMMQMYTCIHVYTYQKSFNSFQNWAVSLIYEGISVIHCIKCMVLCMLFYMYWSLRTHILSIPRSAYFPSIFLGEYVVQSVPVHLLSTISCKPYNVLDEHLLIYLIVQQEREGGLYKNYYLIEHKFCGLV